MKRTTAMNLFAVFLLGLVALLAGCAGGGEDAAGGADAAKASADPVKKAIAWLNPRSGSDMGGSAIFIRDPDGRISLQISLEQAPPGIHAVHIHEFGDCTADDGSSAGGHWNPSGEDHGQWGTAPHHLGDLGNVEVGEDGTGSLEIVTDHWAMGGGSDNDILGKGMIVHAVQDDFTTQPTGAAGGRIGCGVIMIPQ
jgi:Cu-Zn family superoxide dismutase